MSKETKTPITILTGFLGAGKTTLLNEILRADHGLKMAVLVNDFGEVNIDAQLVVGVEGETINLANGCICCSIRGDLEVAVLNLVRDPEPPDYILIEASGISDVGSVALTFVLSPELRAETQVDTILALVDTEHILQLNGRSAMLARRQIGIADLILLNKVDLVSPQKLQLVKEKLRELVPNVRMLETTYGRVPLELVLSVGRRTLQSADTSDMHIHLETEAEVHDHHHHEHDHTDIFSTWHYFSKRPFSYRELHKAIKTLPSTIYRAKGIVYLDIKPQQKHVLQVAGSRIRLTREGEWGTQTPYNELVFIGEAGCIDATQLQTIFDACLSEGERSADDAYKEALSWVREMFGPQLASTNLETTPK